MSSILDALEKAHRKRPKAGTGLAPEDLAEAERRERLVQSETIRHRRIFTLLMAGIGLLASLLAVAIVALLVVALRPSGSQPTPVASAASLPPEQTPSPAEAIAVAPTPSPTPSAEHVTPVPTAEPTVDAETTVAEQAPVATPEASPTATPTPQATPEAARFAHMQVVYDVELGIKIRGVIADGPSSIIMIDNATVALGRRHGKIRPIRIENRMIEAEYDQDGEEITLFIRW